MAKSEPTDLEYREPEVARDVTYPLANSLRDARASVTYRWLERIEERVEVGENEVFPSEDLLDHVPLLIGAVADFMEDPAEEGTAADEVMAKASELGEMRFSQGFSTYQVLKEFEILGGVILAFLRSRVTQLGFTPAPDDVVVMTHRVYRALSKVQQATAARHIALLEEERRDLDRRLRLIRARAGEALAERLGEALEAGPESAPARDLAGRLQDLAWLSDTGRSARRKGVPLAGAVKEAVRRVRTIAHDADVELSVDEPLPQAEVPDAEVEQCLVVYLTNALRHCTEVAGECRVEVGGRADDEELIVSVRNTGSPVEATDDIASLAPPTQSQAEAAPGVGLRFARDLITGLGGRTWAEPAADPDGAVFALALPARRREDGETAAS